MFKKLIGLIGVVICALILEIPDPVPFLDEGVVAVILVRCLGMLGLDLSRFFSSKNPTNSGRNEIEID